MVLSTLLIGFGILLFALGVYFYLNAKKQMKPNEELEWAGFGKHPFRKH